jgi:hypothetical protein
MRFRSAGCPIMIRWIRIRCRSSIFRPYNTPSIFLKIHESQSNLNQLRFIWQLTTASYAGRNNTPSLSWLNDRPPEQSMAPETFFSSHTLSFLRWDHLKLGREPRMSCQIHRSVLHVGASRIFPKEIVIVPICRRSDRSRDKSASAVGTDISQNAIDAGHAEGALIRADARLNRLRRQRLVAMLAGRSEFKHEILDMQLPVMGNQWFLEHFSVPWNPLSFRFSSNFDGLSKSRQLKTSLLY